jgi:hypothetical protein
LNDDDLEGVVLNYGLVVTTEGQVVVIEPSLGVDWDG